MSTLSKAPCALALLLAACANPAEGPAEPPAAPPDRPQNCRDIPAGSALQPALDAAPAGSALCLAPGTYAGPLRITKPLTLHGPRNAVIRSPGTGTTVLVTASGTRLAGFTVSGSGGRFDVLDAAVKVHADDVVLEGLAVEDATFGILVEQARNATIAHCRVRGGGGEEFATRGDGIRLWETNGSRLTDNVVEGGRDLVVWYSSDNLLARNVVRHGRYGTHFMYSHRNRVEDGRYDSNVVGIFAMYSRELTLERNVIAGSAGPAGMGLGVKESGDLTVRENRFVHDAIGIYLDTSPLQEGDSNVFEGNELRLGRAGVVFHSSESRNAFRGNTFRDLDESVQVEGGGDALGVVWDGNDFDDYAGYDLDGDGTGDLPYELRSATGALAANHPETAYFRGTPALGLVEMASKVLPLFEPKLLVRDPHPRMGPARAEVSDAR